MKTVISIKFSEAEQFKNSITKDKNCWLLIVDDPFFDKFRMSQVFSTPDDQIVGAVYFDYIFEGTKIHFYRHMHLLLSEEFYLNHLLIRSDLVDNVEKNLFNTMLNIYKQHLVRHEAVIGLVFE